LVEIQEIGERLAGSNDPFVPMKRVEFVPMFEPRDSLMYWAFEMLIIKFNPATTDREIRLRYLRDPVHITLQPEYQIGVIGNRSFLVYKTAALAAMFVGENQERAAILEDHAQKALERMESIQNKGRQQIMTRHRPFRAAWKARGGF